MYSCPEDNESCQEAFEYESASEDQEEDEEEEEEEEEEDQDTKKYRNSYQKWRNSESNYKKSKYSNQNNSNQKNGKTSHQQNWEAALKSWKSHFTKVEECSITISSSLDDQSWYSKVASYVTSNSNISYSIVGGAALFSVVAFMVRRRRRRVAAITQAHLEGDLGDKDETGLVQTNFIEFSHIQKGIRVW